MLKFDESCQVLSIIKKIVYDDLFYNNFNNLNKIQLHLQLQQEIKVSMSAESGVLKMVTKY